jgi:photosystem II stability/assembly factor-like uncharacterized protein
VYVALNTGPLSSSYLFMRSLDGGTTWTTLDEQHNSQCVWRVVILQGHPTDPNRLFDSADCLFSGRTGANLLQSPDQGASFTRFSQDNDYPIGLIGGEGAAPGRWYEATNLDNRFGGGATLLRSDDDGGSWEAVLTFRGGGQRPGQPPDSDHWLVNLTALAYVPSDPDIVYAARDAYASASSSSVVTSGVTVSRDGGATWEDLGSQQMGGISSLAVGIDGKNLYLGGGQGLWRLEVST